MVGVSIPVNYSWCKIKENKMTDKQYYCQNGDLIEVGKEYKYLDPEVCDPSKVKVTYIAKLKSDWPIMAIIYDGDDTYENSIYATRLLSLWQEQPDKDGWIKLSTGVIDALADDVVVDFKFENGYVLCGHKFGVRDLLDDYDKITHYRIVAQPTNEENSEVNELEETISYLCQEVQQLKFKMEWVENYLKDATKWQK